jgi:hypothetical protein
MSLPRALTALSVLILSSALILACGDDAKDPVDESGPLMEACRADATSQCCANDECGADALCDFSYICSPAPDGGVQCSTPSGSRQCLALCAEDGTCAAAGQVCQEREMFFGSDAGDLYKLCVPD